MALPLALMLVEATAGPSAALRSDRDDKGENDGFTCIPLATAFNENAALPFVIPGVDGLFGPPNSIKNTFRLATTLQGKHRTLLCHPEQLSRLRNLREKWHRQSPRMRGPEGRPPNVSPARKGWGINPQEDPSAVGAALCHQEWTWAVGRLRPT